MVTKLFLLQFIIFIDSCVKLAQNYFQRSAATFQIILLAFLAVNKNL
jgi:hypothetical protein